MAVQAAGVTALRPSPAARLRPCQAGQRRTLKGELAFPDSAVDRNHVGPPPPPAPLDAAPPQTLPQLGSCAKQTARSLIAAPQQRMPSQQQQKTSLDRHLPAAQCGKRCVLQRQLQAPMASVVGKQSRLMQ